MADLLLGHRVAEFDVVLIKRVLIANGKSEAHTPDRFESFCLLDQGHKMARHDIPQCIAIKSVEE